MSGIVWTKGQLEAIGAKSDKILVSAAAGSGKSTVLTERIIRKITSAEENRDISKMLVVTFTRAAAAELQSKIERAIKQAAEENPRNRRIALQLIKLHSAQISTIHGFCNNLIRRSFQYLGISGASRIGDESETEKIRLEIMDRVLEDAYDGRVAGVENFAEFAELFVKENDNKLGQIFMGIYLKIKNQPDGFKAWNDIISQLSPKTEFEKTVYAKLIFKKLGIYLDGYMERYEDALTYLQSEPAYEKGYYSAFMDDFEFMRSLAQAVRSEDYRSIKEIINGHENAKLKGIPKADKSERGEFIKEFLRDEFKNDIKKFKEDYFRYDKDEEDYFRIETANVCRTLLSFLTEFDRQYSRKNADWIYWITTI